MSALVSTPLLSETMQMVTSLGLGFAGLFAALLFYTSLNDKAKEIAFYKAPSFKEVFSGFFAHWKDALALLLVSVAIILILLVIIPFYLRLGNLFGLFISALLFWGVLITLIAMQWFMPLRSQLKDPLMKSIKKCFLLFFDNPGFSIGMFLNTLVLIALSVFLVGLVPGFMGLLVQWNVALKLRMYKYDWIEEHPEVPVKEVKNHINWYDLLEYDRDTIGPRTLKNFIFPWK